jgi:hypothetical protein
LDRRQKLAIIAGVRPASTSSTPAETSIQVKKIPYKGWPNCYLISNGVVELVVTSDIGPRIMRYGFVGGQNLFKEYEDQLGYSGEPTWQLRGGHRIWSAPEDATRTYGADNQPVRIEIHADGLTATQPVELVSGLEKQTTVKLAATGSNARITHRLKNTLPWAIEMAPWALTMMAQGGMGITGFPPRGTHPEALAPTNPLIMWAFTDLSDPRWKFTRKYLMLAQDPSNRSPQKIGHFNEDTWGAYLLGTDLFVKRYRAAAGNYPDLGCSFEVFSRNDMLELETVGPLRKVEPCASAEHVENWSLHAGVTVTDFTDEELDREILPLLGF